MRSNSAEGTLNDEPSYLDFPPEREGRGAAVGRRGDAHRPLPADDVDAAAGAGRDGVLAEEGAPVVEVRAARVQDERVEAVAALTATRCVCAGHGVLRAGRGCWAGLLLDAVSLKRFR